MNSAERHLSRWRPGDSLEYRLPFRDVRMIELAGRIPAHFKVARATRTPGGKRILRDALRGRLPPEIVELPKAGFGSSIPYRQWMKSSSERSPVPRTRSRRAGLD
jgi:asparagine synthase (glutamine-hydrolysing)